MAQPARIVVQNVPQLRALTLDLQKLVDLLLVLDDGEPDLGVLQDEGHFLRHRVLIQGHGHASQALRRRHGPVQARTIVADDGEILAALETEFRQPAGERAHFNRHLGPGPGLPDAEILLADCGPVAANSGVMQQQPRKGIQSGFRHA